MPFTLSKSKYLVGLRCPKLLWCYYHAPQLIPSLDKATQALFDQGHDVGNIAKKRYPNGIEIMWVNGFEQTLQKTQELVKQKKILFEASFQHKNAYCRNDILFPVGDAWDIIEVKSSTKVEDEHVHDVAFQRYCLEGTGLKVRHCYLLHINNTYVKQGEIDAQKLFICENITEQVAQLVPTVEKNIQALIAILQCPTMPHPILGTGCLDPKECPVCLCDLPDDNVTTLYSLGKKAYELINNHIILIRELSDDFPLSDKQQIQKESLLAGKPHIQRNALLKFLQKLRYPLHFLDFETVNPAIPLFDGTRPYQQIPFQFSLHIRRSVRSKPEHIAFLADGPEDPRPALLQALRSIMHSGTVLAYNMSFEKSILRDLCGAFPQETWLSSVIDRLDDLIIPFRNFSYYHPAQHGSCSIKAVLPALTGRSYTHLEISKGDQAAREFLAMTYKKGETKDKKKLRQALLDYCKQDTEGMIEIVNVLENTVNK